MRKGRAKRGRRRKRGREIRRRGRKEEEEEERGEEEKRRRRREEGRRWMVNPSGSRQRSPRSQKPYISSEHSEQNSKRQSRQNVPNSTSGSIVRYKKTESNIHFNLLKTIKREASDIYKVVVNWC